MGSGSAFNCSLAMKVQAAAMQLGGRPRWRSDTPAAGGCVGVICCAAFSPDGVEAESDARDGVRPDGIVGALVGASVGVNVSAAGSTTPAAGVVVLRDDLTTEDQAAGLLGRAVSLADHAAGHVGRAVSFLPIAGKSCGEARRKR